MASHFARIARSIQYLVRHAQRQPSLDEVAADIGWSPGHWQRQFAEHVGISPKQFLQHLTWQRASAALDAGESVLAAAWGGGLSGGGRLHDLSLALEGVTPGQYKARGSGVRLDYGFVETFLGWTCCALSPRGLSALMLIGEGAEARAAAVAALRQRWPEATCVEATERVAEAVATAMDRARGGVAPSSQGRSPLRLHVRGTAFQLQVWRALLAIEPGATTSYSALAQHIGRPQSVRAVANAVGANPVAILIPCHRVLRASGALGGYRWGLEHKQALLAWEGAFTQNKYPD